MPKLSIIIPYYNNTPTIERTLTSLLEQSFQDFEIILIDDGSKDNVRELLKPYGAKLRYYYQENQGNTSAQNLGLDYAEGEFISFCDADDYYLDNDFFANSLKLFAADENVDAVFSGWLIVDEQDNPLSEQRVWEHMPNFSLKEWLTWSPSRFHALILRADSLKRFGKISTKYEMVNDTYFFMSLALAGFRFAWYPHLAVVYVRHPASLMSRRPEQQTFEHMALWRELLEHPAVPPDVDKRAIFYQKLIWSITIRFKNHLDLLALLHENAKYTYHALHAIPFDLLVQVLKQSWMDTYIPRDMEEIIPYFETMIRPKYPFGISGADLLRWWLKVWWWFYLNYQYSAEDIAARKDDWKAALPSFNKPYHYAALSLALMPGAGYRGGKGMSEIITEFAASTQISQAEANALEAIYSLRLLRKEGLKVFRKALSLRAWGTAFWLYLQLFLDSRQSAQRKREL
jgi:glycosyltransferase involved in cell wall biosynthesis